MDLSPISENPRPDGWPGNQQSEHEGDEATAGLRAVHLGTESLQPASLLCFAFVTDHLCCAKHCVGLGNNRLSAICWSKRC